MHAFLNVRKTKQLQASILKAISLLISLAEDECFERVFCFGGLPVCVKLEMAFQTGQAAN
jgi:hypothetical protein